MSAPLTANSLSNVDPLKAIPLLSQVWWGNSIYAYLLAGASFASMWVVLHFLRKAGIQRLARSTSRGGGIWGVVATHLGTVHPLVLPFFAFYLAVQRLQIPALADRSLRFITLTVLVVLATRLIGDVTGYLVTNARLSGRGDDPVSRSVNSNISALIKVALWVAAILFLLDNLGFNVSTFVAGLGIGGVAIALATQAILGDTFSSFAISLDKPFEVGDVITVDGLSGEVEHIGLKTTRVRSVSGELLVFANSDLTRSRIKNYKKMTERRVSFQVGVTYQTALTTLKKIPELLATAVQTAPKVRIDRVHLARLGDSAIIYEVVFFVSDPDYKVSMDLQQEAHFRILEAFERDGIALAYPTQTLILARQSPSS